MLHKPALAYFLSTVAGNSFFKGVPFGMNEFNATNGKAFSQYNRYLLSQENVICKRGS